MALSHQPFTSAEKTERRLINVNLDMLDVAQPPVDGKSPEPEIRRSAGIYTMAEDFINDAHPVIDSSDALSRLSQAHDCLKQVFSDIVTPEIAKKISLSIEKSN